MNLSPLTVKDLRADGFDMIRVSDVMPGSTSDQKILLYARKENRVIVTQDLDFSQLVAISGNAKPSLVTLRLSASDPETITQTLRRVLPQITTALQEGSAVTIDDKNVRVRPLPIR